MEDLSCVQNTLKNCLKEQQRLEDLLGLPKTVLELPEAAEIEPTWESSTFDVLAKTVQQNIELEKASQARIESRSVFPVVAVELIYRLTLIAFISPPTLHCSSHRTAQSHYVYTRLHPHHHHHRTQLHCLRASGEFS
jgi:hypothetical protein